jgi:hypothetical protein
MMGVLLLLFLLLLLLLHLDLKKLATLCTHIHHPVSFGKIDDAGHEEEDDDDDDASWGLPFSFLGIILLMAPS